MATNIKLGIKDVCCVLLDQRPDKDTDDWLNTVAMFEAVFLEKFPKEAYHIKEIFRNILGD